MPTTDHPTTSSSIVSLSPHFSQTRTFTMTDFTPLNDWSFEFAAHLNYTTYHTALKTSIWNLLNPLLLTPYSLMQIGQLLPLTSLL